MIRARLPAAFAGIMLAAGALTACATVEDTVHVPYAAHGTPVAPVPNVRVTVTAADARTTNRGRISTKKNGYGMDMAAIRSDSDVADVVRGALGDELKARGYGLGPGGPVVDAQVKTFYADFATGLLSGSANGSVDLTVTVVRGGAPVYTRDLHGTARKNVQLASGSNAAAAISAALGVAVDQLFADPAFVQALVQP